MADRVVEPAVCSECDSNDIIECENCEETCPHTCHLDGEEYGPYCADCGGEPKC